MHACQKSAFLSDFNVWISFYFNSHAKSCSWITIKKKYNPLFSMKRMVGVSYVNYPISPIDEECPWWGTSCYFWSFIILFFQRNCTTSVFSDWLRLFVDIDFLTLLLKKKGGEWYDYFSPRHIIRVIIKIHALFCYYAIKRQISTKLIGENKFCMQAHQPSIVLPSKSRLVQLRIYNCYTKTCFFLGVSVIFPEWITSGQLYYSDVMILFDLYIIFELFLKL